jgi:prepilin peptidase CpaA
MDTPQLHVVVALGVTAVSAGIDLASRKIPQTLTFGGIVAGFALNMWSGFAFAGFGGAARAFGLCLLGMFLSAFIPFWFFLRKEVGGGDVKLMMAIGAFVGPLFGFSVLAYTYAVILATLPFRLVVQGRMRALFENVRGSLANLSRPKDQRVAVTPFRMPSMAMGPAILVGFALCAWNNWRFL